MTPPPPGRIESAPRNPLATARRVLRMVSALHARGYGRTRILPGMSPSGMYWRVCIAPASAFGSLYTAPRAWADTYPRWSTGANDPFDWTDFHDRDEEALAERSIATFPALAAEAAGKDADYVEWYDYVFEAADSHELPVFYADYDLGPPVATTGTATLPPPPALPR